MRLPSGCLLLMAICLMGQGTRHVCTVVNVKRVWDDDELHRSGDWLCVWSRTAACILFSPPLIELRFRAIKSKWYGLNRNAQHEMVQSNQHWCQFGMMVSPKAILMVDIRCNQRKARQTAYFQEWVTSPEKNKGCLVISCPVLLLLWPWLYEWYNEIWNIQL